VELGLEYGVPVMNIGGQSLKFEEGQWTSGNDYFEYPSSQTDNNMHIINQ
jgi:hypothetical protein